MIFGLNNMVSIIPDIIKGLNVSADHLDHLEGKPQQEVEQ